MWTAKCQVNASSRITVVSLRYNGHAITFGRVIACWRDDGEFREFFINLLSEFPYSAYRWETPSVTLATQNLAFEFAVLEAKELDRPVDPSVFASHFTAAPTSTMALAFANLSGDSRLIVPRPTSTSDFGHLASFTRQATSEQNHALWQLVGNEMTTQLCNQPIWLSTAGMGVSWLHVRIDSRPKYYAYSPYKQPRLA